MAKAITTMQVGVTEVLPLAKTPITCAFSQMVAALTTHLVAERSFDTRDLSAAERALWLQEAALARSQLLDLLIEIQETAQASPLDRPLVRMAGVVEWLVRSDEPDEFIRRSAALPGYAPFLSIPGADMASAAIAALMRRAERGLEMLADLPRYRGAPACAHDDLAGSGPVQAADQVLAPLQAA